MTVADQAETTARVNADDARIDILKEKLRTTPKDLDFERVRIMHEVYGESAGDNQMLRRAKFLAAVLERKKLYIDDNLFVGAMGGKRNAVYTYPEWQVDWMIEEKTSKIRRPQKTRRPTSGRSNTGANGR